MEHNNHTGSNATYAQIPSRPDSHGWVEFLRDRLPFSFGKIKKDHKKRIFLLDEPIPPPIKDAAIFYEEFNLWSRALAFYAGGKVVDASTLTNILPHYQQLLMYTTQQFSHETSLKVARNGIWDSEQLHRLLLLLNRNRLECERASTTLIVHALEFIIKAMCVHCNYYTKEVFYFQESHDLDTLYTSLPKGCREEISVESLCFVKEYESDRANADTEITSIIERLVDSEASVAGAGVSKGLQEIRNAVKKKKFMDVLTGSETTVGGAEMVEKGWLEKALTGAGGLISHRYGPVPKNNEEWVSGHDPYSTHAIAHAQLAARFFLEHLFGVIDPRNNPWRPGQ